MKVIVFRATSVAILCVLTTLFLNYGDNYIGRSYLFFTNVVVMPFLVGTAAYFLLGKRVIPASLWIIFVPLTHLTYFSEDTTKVGLNNAMVMVEFVFMVISILLTAGVMALLRPKVTSIEQRPQ